MGEASRSFWGRAKIGLIIASAAIMLLAPTVAFAANTATFTSRTPASGSRVSSTRQPSIKAVVYDRYGVRGTGTITLYVDGVRVTPSVSYTMSRYRRFTLAYVPRTPLANGTHRVYIVVKDLKRHVSTISWSFSEVAPPPPSCTSCHGTSYALDNAMGPNCTGCHSGRFAPKHGYYPADYGHPFPAGKAVCLGSGCHSSGGMVPFEGKNIGKLHPTCTICHGGGKTATLNCTTTGCHPEKALPHGYEVTKHLAAPAAQIISINGVGHGPFACSTCHTTLELGPIHLAPAGTATCMTCHSSIVPAISTGWKKGCVQGGCHAASGAHPMHGSVNVSHARLKGTAFDACFSFSCHLGGADAAAIHAVPGALGCVTCHGAGKTPTKDCSKCHSSQAHGF